MSFLDPGEISFCIPCHTYLSTTSLTVAVIPRFTRLCIASKTGCMKSFGTMGLRRPVELSHTSYAPCLFNFDLTKMQICNCRCICLHAEYGILWFYHCTVISDKRNCIDHCMGEAASNGIICAHNVVNIDGEFQNCRMLALFP